MFRSAAPKKEMTRGEITELFIVRAAPAEREELRRILDRMTAEQLQTAYEALQRQVQLDLTEERYHQALAESAAEDLRHQLRMQEAREPQRKAEERAQLETDRKTFLDAAKSLRSFGLTEANFNVTRSILGPGFSTYDIQQALGSNALQLSQATQAELSEWTREAKEAEIRRLKSMDLTSLRKVVREEGARGPVTPPLDETQRVRQAETTAASKYPPLPDEYRDGDGPEQVLNAQFIKTCSAATLKRLIQRYGSAQIDQVLRGETRTEEVWKY